MNSSIPKEKCKVRYPDFEEAVRLCLKAGKSCKMGKSDMALAFRHLPMRKQDWKYLLMKAEHPETKKVYYFVDKCMPFGSSISCAHFQAVSDAIAHIVECLNNERTVNYLDDFFFAALLKYLCDQQMKVFLDVCQKIKFPVALEKMFWGTTMLTFLGLLLDSERQLVCIPIEKICKANEIIDFFLDPRVKKVTVLQIQQLCGYLNFPSCVIPGCAFTIRLYSLVSGNSKLKQHHHVKIKEETRLDLLVWKKFLSSQRAFCIPFMETGDVMASEINMYSDASGKIGFEALCDCNWMKGMWEPSFLEQEPSIEYLELFAVTAGILTWIRKFQNKRVILFCDNISVVHMMNGSASKCKNCMILIRLIALEGM